MQNSRRKILSHFIVLYADVCLVEKDETPLGLQLCLSFPVSRRTEWVMTQKGILLALSLCSSRRLLHLAVVFCRHIPWCGSQSNSSSRIQAPILQPYPLGASRRPASHQQEVALIARTHVHNIEIVGRQHYISRWG